MVDQMTMATLVIQNLDIVDTTPKSPQTPSNNQEEATGDNPETSNVNNNAQTTSGPERTTEEEEGGVDNTVPVAESNPETNNVNNDVQTNGAERTTEEKGGVANTVPGDAVVDMSAIVGQLGEGRSFDDMQEGEGAIIVLGDNDSVSSLDSKDSFANEDSEEEEERDHRRHRSNSRRKRERTKREPKLRELSPLFKNPERQRQQPNRKSRSTSTRLQGAEKPESVQPATRASSWDVGLPTLSPNMPRRQRTREAMKKPMPVLSRNHSTPDLISPRSNSDKSKTLSPNPRKNLATSVDRNSVKSLNCLELLYDEDEDEHNRNPYPSYYNQTELHKQTSGQSNCSSSRWQEDCESSANTASRWSASTGTANRSMNTAQLEVLSTVPRFPRRQKTGDVKQLRLNTSQDSNNNATSSGTSTNNPDTTGMNESTHTGHVPKKRPQLPNRQKSFRRGVLTMNQAAQAALAKASGTPVPPVNLSPNGGGQSSPKAPPKQPRRSVSKDSSSGMSKQKSLPNLNPQGKKPQKKADPLSVSMHNSPRLPTRRASRDRTLCSLGNGLGSSSHHSRIRRAKSDGAQHIQMPQMLLQDDSMLDESSDSASARSWLGPFHAPKRNNNHHSSGMTASMQSQFSKESNSNQNHHSGMASSMNSQLSRDESSNQNHHNSSRTGMAGSMHSQLSRESSFSTGMNDSTIPKIPRRQASHEDMPVPSAVAAKIHHNNQQQQKLADRDQKMDTILQELASNDSSSESESDEYEEDVLEEDKPRRRPMDLPPHLQAATRQVSNDSSARLPLRQMSVSEHRGGEDDDNDALHVFSNKAANALGASGLEEDENEEEDERLLLLAPVESPLLAEEEPPSLLMGGGGEFGGDNGEGNKPDDEVKDTEQ